MEPIKIAGLTLKSEVPSEKERKEDAIIEDIDPSFANAASEDTIDRLKDEDLVIAMMKPEENTFVPDNKEKERASTIQESLLQIITRVEALDKTDNTIKAIGKLKGALELLSWPEIPLELNLNLN